MQTTMTESTIPSLQLGNITLTSRLVVGTGKYPDYETMEHALDQSGCSAVTVAVRRERLVDDQGRSILDFIDTDRYTILPNTAGCFSAEDAVRVKRAEGVGECVARVWLKGRADDGVLPAVAEDRGEEGGGGGDGGGWR